MGKKRHILRFFDLVLSAAGLVVTSPFLLVAILVHRLTSSGSAIFAQKRIGRDERIFLCLKLRTMHVDTPQVATHQVSASAVTYLGRFLRRTKMDELPQLWNVLKGEMSLVGPRPCLPSQTVLIEARRARGVNELPPGITGPAQVLGVDMSDPERLARIDESWVHQWSLGRYFGILIATATGSGSGDRIGV